MNRRFSIQFLLFLTLAAACVIAVATYRPFPKIGQMHYRDASDVLHVYELENATCGIHFDGDWYLLNFRCETSLKISRSKMPTHLPWLSVSLPSLDDPSPKLIKGSSFTAPTVSEDYDPSEPLTNIYYGTHEDLKNARVLINDVTDTYVDATIMGIDEQRVIVRGKFKRTTSGEH